MRIMSLPMETLEMQDTFVKEVIEQFQFLIDEYGFQVTKIGDHAQYSAKAEGLVEYRSPVAFVIVMGEWYWNGVSFGRAEDDQRFDLCSELVYEYLSLTPEERAIVCSHDPKNSRTASMLRYSQLLQHEKREYTDKKEEIHAQLADHARWLRQYADPFLRGDFSKWLEIYEYKVGAMIGDYKRSGKSEEALRFMGKDENGKPIMIKTHIFQSSLDYLAGLREKPR